jgi:ribosomal protein S27AE
MQHDNDLVHEAYINLKAGDHAAARRYAERALLIADDVETQVKASFILSQITDDPKEKRDLLETVLAYDRNHAEARRALAILDGKLKPEDIVNADNLPAQSTDKQNASADRFTCPKCGARRVFAPDGHNLVCEHCGYNDSLANAKEADEQDFFTAMATAKGHDKPVATQVFHCQGCGAEFVLAPGVLSATCAYCDSPHVVRLEGSRELIEPEGIIPHALTQKQAVQFLVKWVEKNKLKPERKVDFPRGAYLPLWTFDLGGVIGYSGEIVETEYEGLRQNQRIVSIHDDYPLLINDWPIPASKKISGRLARLLPTFDLSAVQPYDPRFLADWPAEIYDFSMSDASLEARSQAFAYFKEDLPTELLQLNNLHLSSANMAVESFKLVLIPVWLTEIPLAGQKRSILINGQNGKIVK